MRKSRNFLESQNIFHRSQHKKDIILHSLSQEESEYAASHYNKQETNDPTTYSLASILI